MDDQQELDYRNLLGCRIEVASSSGSALQSSVRLPQECYNAANISLPALYDFALGTYRHRQCCISVSVASIESARSTRVTGVLQAPSFASSPVYIAAITTQFSTLHNLYSSLFFPEKSILQKHNKGNDDTMNGSVTTSVEEHVALAEMKSVTNADDQVCVAILENNNYDLKTSIEAFFQSPSGTSTVNR